MPNIIYFPSFRYIKCCYASFFTIKRRPALKKATLIVLSTSELERWSLRGVKEETADLRSGNNPYLQERTAPQSKI